MLRLGDFVLSGGDKTFFMIDCGSLDDQSVECLAKMIARLTGKFSSVEGVPEGGGDRLAKALEGLATPGKPPTDHDPARLPRGWQEYGQRHGPHLIVAGTCATGASLEKARRAHLDGGDVSMAMKGIVGGVAFCRGTLPNWCKACFFLDEALKGA